MKPKLIIVGLVVLLVILQFRLWFGGGSLAELNQLRQTVAEQTRQNEVLRERNAFLEAEVRDLKTHTEAIEEISRLDLGMIKPGETFFQIIEK